MSSPWLPIAAVVVAGGCCAVWLPTTIIVAIAVGGCAVGLREWDTQKRSLPAELQRREAEERRRHAEDVRRRKNEECRRRDEQWAEHTRQWSDMMLRRDEEIALQREKLTLLLGQRSAQYLNHVLIDMGIKRNLFRTTGRCDGKGFPVRLQEFVSRVIVPDDTDAEPVRPAFRDDYNRLQQILSFSPEGLRERLGNIKFLATELNAPHHRVVLTHGPGFYVAGWQFNEDLVAVITLICVALQRSPEDDFPPVHVLTRDNRVAFHVRGGVVVHKSPVALCI